MEFRRDDKKCCCCSLKTSSNPAQPSKTRANWDNPKNRFDYFFNDSNGLYGINNNELLA